MFDIYILEATVRPKTERTVFICGSMCWVTMVHGSSVFGGETASNGASDNRGAFDNRVRQRV